MLATTEPGERSFQNRRISGSIIQLRAPLFHLANKHFRAVGCTAKLRVWSVSMFAAPILCANQSTSAGETKRQDVQVRGRPIPAIPTRFYDRVLSHGEEAIHAEISLN
jgi:hypothetical protein